MVGVPSVPVDLDGRKRKMVLLGRDTVDGGDYSWLEVVEGVEDAREEVQRGGVELALEEGDVADGVVGEVVLAHGALVSLEHRGGVGR